MRSYLLSFLALAFTASVSAQNVSNIHVNACDRATKNGDTLIVNYNGTFTNGTLFDSSYSGNSSDPFSFKLGAHEVITGWDLGMTNMCIGDRRKLVLSPDLAYGNRTVGPIPPNSILVFWTELEGIQ
ncbi:hypothetical protein N431DRAFT_466963 [Stipitochalara longipes BDJ]|nr:hypothetical protein N431DRAFT_466963 [Stipitochalara longipes BDJ]